MNNLLGIDWREAWKQRDVRRAKPGDAAYWDERSKNFSNHCGVSAYTQTFIEYLNLEPASTVFDMGSGPGTIAIPLAKARHEVIAADFSAGMRAEAKQRAQQEGVDITIMPLDWNDDWQAQGIMPKSVDVVVASRSTMVADLGDVLEKMDRTAKKKVALTMTTEYGPKDFKPRGSKQDESDEFLADYIYCFNILIQMGAYPQLRYIDTTHGNGGTREEALVRWAFIEWTPLSAKHEG